MSNSIKGFRFNGNTYKYDYTALDNAPNVETDKTLAISNRPADAKTVGDEIASIRNAVGTPLTAETASGMTDINKIYVYTGSETGYTNGNWYYFDTAQNKWVSGGIYNSAVINTDDTLTQAGEAADAKATGDEITGLKSALDDLFSINTTWSDGYWIGTGFNTNNSYKHTDYIAINELAIPIKYKLKVINTVASYVLFDENKNYIDKKNTTSTSLVEVEEIITDYKNASYVVFETNSDYSYHGTLNYCKVYDSTVQGFMRKTDKIDQDQLSFADFVPPKNLFNYEDGDMCKRGYWYYSTTVGSTVSAQSNEYTTSYVAIKFPVFDAAKVTIGMYPNSTPKKVYWVGAVTEDMKLITYQTINDYAPQTYTIPNGTVYLLVSYNLGSANFDTLIPIIVAIDGEEITKYVSYTPPYYYLNECRVDVGVTPEIESIQTIVGTNENSIKICASDEYDLVVGDTFQLFYKGIINAVHPEIFDVTVTCAFGSAYERYFEITPTTAGNISASITVYGINHNILDSRTITLKVHAKPTSPVTQKNILCVGDSLTTNGVWVEELHRRLCGTGGTPAGDELSNLNFIGTREINGVHYEGYGGNNFDTYNSDTPGYNVRIITTTHDKTTAEDQHSVYKDSTNTEWKLETIDTNSITIIAVNGEGRNFPDSGTLTWVSGGVHHADIVYIAQQMGPGNPFWDSEQNKVDFSTYASNQGVSSIDYVYVLLGWNSWAWTDARISESAQAFINNVHDSFPDAVITLVGLEVPARDGLSKNYGASNNSGYYYFMLNFVFRIDSIYKQLSAENTNVYAINLSGQFDTEYNMQTATRQVNTRNTETITYQSNGVHPATTGYYQIADAIYRDFVKLI